MKANEILKALNLCKNKYTTLHCAKLAAIYSLLIQIKNEIVIAKIVQGNIEMLFGQYNPVYGCNCPTSNIGSNDGEAMTANKITVLTEKSEYSFAVPVANEFYYLICDLLGLPYEIKGIEKIEALKTFEVNSEVISSIKKAAKFASKDGLRPAMTCVCLDITNKGLKVAATDAHRLYLSKQYNLQSSENMQLLIDSTSVKLIAGMKVKDETIKIELLPVETIVIGMITQYDEKLKEFVEVENKQDVYSFLFNGLKVQYYVDLRFPDYKVVIPELKSKMVFDRVNFIDNVKSVMPSANKSTNQVNFHLNGNILMNAFDIDFSFECSKEMAYTTKDFKDTDIAFNGKFLVEGLNIFKTKEISMYSEGSATKAAIFTDEVDTILIMPLMLNN